MMEQATRIMISAGEVSGDQRAGEFLQALQQRYPKLEVCGMGGAELEKLGMQLLVDSRQVGGVMGFSEVVGQLNQLRAALELLALRLKHWRPQALVLVDFPDFNLRLAKRAKALGVPVLYFVPPKIWAWRGYRIRQIRERVDLVASIFPFEPDFYRTKGFNGCEYVGHPFLEKFSESFVALGEGDSLRSDHPKIAISRMELDLPLERPIVAVLPGSRSSEIRRHFDLLQRTLRWLAARGNDFLAVWVVPNDELGEQLSRLIAKSGASESYESILKVGVALEVMGAADVGLLKSGTCNLEAAFLGLPSAVFYRVSPVTALIVRSLVGLSEFSICNIIKPGSVPEFMQSKAKPEQIGAFLEQVLEDDSFRTSQVESLQGVVDAFRVGMDSTKPLAFTDVGNRVVDLLERLLVPSSSH